MTDLLFAARNLRQVLESHERKLHVQIDGIDENRLLNTSVDDLCDYLEQEYRVDPLRIDENSIQVDYGDAQIDVSRRFEYGVFGDEGSVHVKGTTVTFFIPYEGDTDLWKCKPSTFNLNPPRAVANENEILIAYSGTEHDTSKFKERFQRELDNLKSFLGWIERDVTDFNSKLRAKIRTRIETRREKILNDRGLVNSLGFPLRRRPDAPTTYVAPTKRRKVPRPMPPASETPFVPEPTLDTQEYEHILSVISNMVAVMERSPKAFKNMGEEDLRHHFLVQLNGQYEGQAAGETFNFEGKTDILIRERDRNIFIAECKFWNGPRSLTAAIDQLLGYATWRDTKTALLIFNRGRSLSTVLAKIPEVAQSHPNFKRESPYNTETGYRFVLGHKDDTNREIIVTVLVFEVPG